MAPKTKYRANRRPPVNRQNPKVTATQPITVTETNAAEALMEIAFKAYSRNPGLHAENEARTAQYLAKYLINEKVIAAIEEEQNDVRESIENAVKLPYDVHKEVQIEAPPAATVDALRVDIS
jgi:hypothetical protein